MLRSVLIILFLRMEKQRNAYRVLVGTREGKRLAARPTHRGG
jgi:hypothetical protein